MVPPDDWASRWRSTRVGMKLPWPLFIGQNKFRGQLRFKGLGMDSGSWRKESAECRGPALPSAPPLSEGTAVRGPFAGCCRVCFLLCVGSREGSPFRTQACPRCSGSTPSLVGSEKRAHLSKPKEWTEGQRYRAAKPSLTALQDQVPGVQAQPRA